MRSHHLRRVTAPATTPESACVDRTLRAQVVVVSLERGCSAVGGRPLYFGGSHNLSVASRATETILRAPAASRASTEWHAGSRQSQPTDHRVVAVRDLSCSAARRTPRRDRSLRGVAQWLRLRLSIAAMPGPGCCG